MFQFDPQDCPPGLVNYWGYSPVSFFAPHAGYSSRRDPLGCVDEFRDLVKALHRAGIEVMFTAYWEPLVFELPPMLPGHPPWRRWIDTYRSPPDDIHEPAFGPPVQGPTYTVQPRSLVTLFAEGTGAVPAGPASPRRR